MSLQMDTDNTNKPGLEVDTTKRRVLFYHCGSAAQMEQLAMQRLAELARTAPHSRSKEYKAQWSQINRERHILLQWLTGPGVSSLPPVVAARGASQPVIVRT